ncbi:hypothetical protein BCR35DRAFT_331583 [Leucosporidium creatinivorum]|uniref:F-box domain-containing protein n=1 Tax=Leucosporidium creatinivorum TaxID=106004 RepID=A0A1Y2FD27_9BASI|nr:hypothetical protein BCR35DRAFT_331583 [Leucosporidium creatinivorum]
MTDVQISEKLASPTTALSSSPTYFDRLPRELKIQILEWCDKLDDKITLCEFSSTCTEFRRLGEPIIFGDLTFFMDYSLDMVNFDPNEVDVESFLPFFALSQKYGHLMKRMRVDLATSNVLSPAEPELVTAKMRWESFQESLGNLSALEHLDIDCLPSLIHAPGMHGNDHLLRASPTIGRTLTSLRLVGLPFPSAMSAPRVAEILVNLPLLTSLILKHVEDPGLDMSEALRLQEAVTGLLHLRELRLSAVMSKVIQGATFDGPLELLACENVAAPALFEAIRPLGATFHTLTWCNYSGHEPEPLTNLTPLDLPHLRHLALNVRAELSILDLFASGRLETLHCCQYEDAGSRFAIRIDPLVEQINLAAVRRTILRHKDSLRQLGVHLLSHHDHVFDLLDKAEGAESAVLTVYQAAGFGEGESIKTEARKVRARWDGIAELCRLEGIDVGFRRWDERAL